MTTNTFYASTSSNGISLGGETSLSPNVIIAIHNPTNSLTQVTIKNLYWTYISGTMGHCNLVWAQSAQGANLSGTSIIPASLCNSGSSVCEVHTGTSVLVKTPILIRPSEISFNNSMLETVESFNFNEFTVAPGWVLSISSLGTAGTDDKSIITLVWQEVI